MTYQSLTSAQQIFLCSPDQFKDNLSPGASSFIQLLLVSNLNDVNGFASYKCLIPVLNLTKLLISIQPCFQEVLQFYGIAFLQFYGTLKVSAIVSFKCVSSTFFKCHFLLIL